MPITLSGFRPRCCADSPKKFGYSIGEILDPRFVFLVNLSPLKGELRCKMDLRCLI